MKGNQNNGRRNGNRRGRKEAGTGRNDSRVRSGGKEVSKVREEPIYNDPAWYTVNEQLVKDTASFSFGTPTGTVLRVNNYSDYTQSFAYNIPGFMSIPTIPTPGYSISETSPLNVAMRKFFRDVRKGNSGATNYDAPDLMLYILAMDSVYCWFATLVRLYGLARTFSVYNRFYGNGLCLAQIFHPDVTDELAWLRGFINKLAVKINQFAVPAQIPLFKRHYWMYTNAFLDDPSPKAQVYMYIPAALYQYDETSGPGKLQLIDVTHSIYAATSTSSGGAAPRAFLGKQDIINITAQLMDPILQSQDFNIMSGDIVKFWDKELFTLELIPDNFQVIPVYSQEVLSQIHNTTFAGRGICAADGTLGWVGADVLQATSIQNGGYLVCSPHFVGYTSDMAWDKLCDMYKLDVSPGEVMVATRNMISGTQSRDSSTGLYMSEPWAFASDICLYAIIGVYNNNTLQMVMECGQDVVPTATSVSRVLREFSQFTQAPYVYNHSLSAPNALTTYCGQVNNYRLMSRNDLELLHESAIMALLGLTE